MIGLRERRELEKLIAPKAVMYLRGQHVEDHIHGYLVSFDPATDDIRISERAELAHRFASKQEALELYRFQSRLCPLRVGLDNMPNRPLTRFHAEVVNEGTIPLLAIC